MIELMVLLHLVELLSTIDKVLDTVSQPETFQKAEQLINRKLDKMLGDPEK